jgi:hypothetical protein
LFDLASKRIIRESRPAVLRRLLYERAELRAKIEKARASLSRLLARARREKKLCSPDLPRMIVEANQLLNGLSSDWTLLLQQIDRLRSRDPKAASAAPKKKYKKGPKSHNTKGKAIYVATTSRSFSGGLPGLGKRK